jgi:hypothetical protein
VPHRDFQVRWRKRTCRRAFVNARSSIAKTLRYRTYVTPIKHPELVFVHAEIVSRFVNYRQADLFADFSPSGADRFNILLI